MSQLLGCPESYAEPKEIYRRLKERGMSFVTITDHNTIDGVLEIADLKDVFISCEYTVAFPEEPVSVHVLVYGLDEKNHDDLMRLRDNVYDFVSYLVEKDLAFSLAHPLYTVNNSKLNRRVVEKFVLLFDNWEVINGTRADAVRHAEEAIARRYDGWESIHELENRHRIKALRRRPFIAFTAGSDDHGGMDVGRTWTQAPAKSVEEFLKALKEGRTQVGTQELGYERPLNMVLRVGYDYLKRNYRIPKELGGFLDYVFMHSNDPMKEVVLRYLLDTNAERHILPKELLKKLPFITLRRLMESPSTSTFGEVLLSFISQALPVGIAYVFNGEKLKALDLAKTLGAQTERTPKLAYITDTYHEINGVSRTARIVRELSKEYDLPVDVIIADQEDYREDKLIALKSYAEFPLPYYPEFKVRIPSLIDLLDLFQKEGYTHVHVSTPSALGLMALVLAKALHLKVSFTFHTDVPSYAFVYTQSKDLEESLWKAFSYLGNLCDKVFVPSLHYGRLLSSAGVDFSKVKVFKRGVDMRKFNPSYKDENFWSSLLGIKKERKVLLYVGRVSKEKNLDALVYLAKVFPEEVFVVVGDGPYKQELEKKRPKNLFLTGYVEGESLSKAYASSYAFVFPSETDTYAQVVLEAMASGLPVLVSSKGAAHEHVEDSLNGFVCHTQEDFAYKLALLLEKEELRENMSKEALSCAVNMDIRETYLDYLNRIMDGQLSYETA